MKYFNKKMISLLLIGGITLTSFGCGGTTKNEDSQITIEENINGQNQEKEYTENDVIDFFNELFNQLKAYLNSEDVEIYKEDINSILVKMVGFLFYDDQILGWSLKDISDSGKQEIKGICAETIIIMEEKYPEFTIMVKDDFTEVQKKSANLYNKGKDKLNGFVQEVIGEQEYKNIKATGINEIDKAKSKVKSKVDNFYNGTNK